MTKAEVQERVVRSWILVVHHPVEAAALHFLLKLGHPSSVTHPGLSKSVDLSHVEAFLQQFPCGKRCHGSSQGVARDVQLAPLAVQVSQSFFCLTSQHLPGFIEASVHLAIGTAVVGSLLEEACILKPIHCILASPEDQ
eukprot:CAMPEP_0197655768 /NCGR_PEP_ID=MMETSP1338-20131121/39657_1 /TAXON_ID=43686 ORGANISM="Pelagodinium beii, Strain RCC1491" /NCGR_SAMPLE_ID=MMETSP1338 /ASSEMBLY_ACC=CAM_ASM_000754 /LENGTH=138 /DNA_ID=CAMNT_0043231483 /DNA_START=258 /DNA_END=674 /DNA_ORIENTATION=+